MAKIVTGYTGTPHVSADDMAAFQQGVVGVEDYALYNGSDFTATTATASTVKLSKAEIVAQGTHIRVDGTEVVTINAGSQGMYRYDLIIAKYSKAANGVESAVIEVKQGTPVASGAVYPELTKGDIRNGGSVREVALFAVYLYGSNIQSITRVIPIVDSLQAMQSKLAEVGTIISGGGDTINIASGSSGTTAVAQVTLPAGTWIVNGSVYFASANGGYRASCIHNRAAYYSAYDPSSISTPAVEGNYTVVNSTKFVTVTQTTTLYLNARQGQSGTKLDVSGRLQAVKIA